MTFRRAVPALAALLLLAPPAPDRVNPRNDLLVPVAWLAEHHEDENIVLLHVGPEDGFGEEHIPGARYVSHRAISHPSSHGDGALILELPEPGTLQETLRSLGVNDDSRIVVYWGDSWLSPTARVVFTLQWAGLGDRTVLLDGGLAAWKKAGHPVTSETRQPRPGTVTLHPQHDLVVNAEWIARHTPESREYRLVDGRARAFYDGVREDRHRAGHIPGAGSLPWVELFDDQDRLKSAAELRALFAEAGVREGQTVVAYCHIGQYATAVIFAARTLGLDVKLYDGAWQDWARRELPAETH